MEAKPENPPISKKQLKRQAREAKWQSEKQALKKQKKEKYKEKKRIQRAALEQKRLAGEQITPEELAKYSRPRRGRGFKQELKQKLASAPRVVIDCSFDEHHGTKEFVSMARQLEHCLNLNKKFPNPIKIVLTGLSTQMEEVLKPRNFQNWPVEVHREPDFKKIYATPEDYSQLTYLTGDCETDMTEYDASRVYIIGGIVDHNKLKNLTAGKAASLGIRVERFPLSKHISLKSSAILSINHSFEILVRKYNGQEWGQLLKEAIPERKKDDGLGEDGPQELSPSESLESEEGESGEEEQGDQQMMQEERV